MNSFFLKKNNNYTSIDLLERSFLSLKNLKNTRNKILNDKYINKNIRRKSLISFQFLISTNEINKFTLSGIIVKKNKQNNLNNSITVKAILSKTQVKVNFHLYSNSTRLV